MKSAEYCRTQEDLESAAAAHRLAMLTLHTINTPPPPPVVPSLPVTRCTDCDSSSSSAAVKRRSSSSFDSLQEPTAKRQLLPPPSPSYATTDLFPILRCCISDPVTSPETASKINGPETTPSPEISLSPPHPVSLLRCLSDSIQPPCQLTTSSTPPRTLSRSPSSGELSNRAGRSPSLKKLRKMKERMREIIQWWEQILQEEEENKNGDGGGRKYNSCKEDETEEALSVERRGDCLIILFKCPCQKGCQILFSGNDCYYKLIFLTTSARKKLNTWVLFVWGINPLDWRCNQQAPQSQRLVENFEAGLIV